MTSLDLPTPPSSCHAPLGFRAFGRITAAAADRRAVGLSSGERRLLISRNREHSEQLAPRARYEYVRYLRGRRHETELGHLLLALGPVVSALLRHREQVALVAGLVEQQMRPDPSPELGSPGPCWWQPPQRPRSTRASELEMRAAELQLLVIRAAVAASSVAVVRTAPFSPSAALRRVLQARYFDVEREAGHMAVSLSAIAAWHDGAPRAVGACDLRIAWTVADVTATFELSARRSIRLSAEAG
jgi:hypothetical protein